MTGNTYSCSVGGLSQSVGEGAELLDDAIISMISYQNDPVPQLRAVLLGDPQCGLATCLLAIELLRNPPAYAADADADDVTDGATGADDGAQVENVAKTAAAASAALAAASSKSTKAEIEKVAAGACLVSLLRAPLTTCLASISLLISFTHSLTRTRIRTASLTASTTPAHSPPSATKESHALHSAQPGEVHALLAKLEREFALLNDREQRYASAALAWSRGHFYTCAALLESVVQSSGNTTTTSASGHGATGGDALAVRLAQVRVCACVCLWLALSPLLSLTPPTAYPYSLHTQAAYVNAGDAEQALSCVSRSLQTLDDSHFLHGHIMGMQVCVCVCVCYSL